MHALAERDHELSEHRSGCFQEASIRRPRRDPEHVPPQPVGERLGVTVHVAALVEGLQRARHLALVRPDELRQPHDAEPVAPRIRLGEGVEDRETTSESGRTGVHGCVLPRRRHTRELEVAPDQRLPDRVLGVPGLGMELRPPPATILGGDRLDATPRARREDTKRRRQLENLVFVIHEHVERRRRAAEEVAAVEDVDRFESTVRPGSRADDAAARQSEHLHPGADSEDRSRVGAEMAVEPLERSRLMHRPGSVGPGEDEGVGRE